MPSAWANRGKPQWPSPSPLSYLQVPCAHAALLHCGGDHSKVRKLWLSHVAMPGALLVRPGIALSPEVGWVLSSGPYGVLVLVGEVHHGRDDVEWVEFMRAGCKWEQWFVDSLEGWQCYHSEPRLPAHVDVPDVRGAPSALRLELEGEMVSLLEYGAIFAFAHLTKSVILDLMDHVQIKPRGAAGFPVAALVRLLVEFALPHLDVEAVDAVCVGTFAEAGDKFDRAIADEEDFAGLDGVVDDDDMSNIKSDVQQYLKASASSNRRTCGAREGAGARATTACGSGGTPDSTAVAACVPPVHKNVIVQLVAGDPLHIVPRPIVDKVYSAVEARMFLPSEKGVTLAIHCDRQWILKYPLNPDGPPWSRSCTWNDQSVSCVQALCYVLKWGWDCHRRRTGECCSWDLDSHLDGSMCLRLYS